MLVHRLFLFLVFVLAGSSFAHADKQYNGIPLVPGAKSGKEIVNSAYYEYRTKKSLKEVESFYTKYYQRRGWSKSIAAKSKKHVLTGGPSVDIRFSSGDKLPVNMVLMYSPKERSTLVWLKNKNFNAKKLSNPKVRDENAEKLLRTILD